MKSSIDMIEKYLKEHSEMFGVTVKAFGDTFEIPENIPYVNILPRRKPRDRVFLIGGDPLYKVNQEIIIEVWDVSVDDLGSAFRKCESLAEKILDILADLSVSDLDVDYHEEQIEEFLPDHWEMSYYYMATILMKLNKDENHGG